MTAQMITITLWLLRLVAAAIMLQTLFFKFTGAEESIYIFSQLGMEPWGRIGTGVLELIAALLILYPRTTFLGAILSAGLMTGAIGMHIAKLGIVVREDGGLLFIYALIVLICSVALLYFQRNELASFMKSLVKKN